jgi:RNA recognition motif-containing protein
VKALQAGGVGPTRIYVGSIPFNVGEPELKAVFTKYGEIEFVNMHFEADTGKSKGFAFIQFKKPEDAKKALKDNGVCSKRRERERELGEMSSVSSFPLFFFFFCFFV